MKSKATQHAKEEYQRLRALSWEELWQGEAAQFDRAAGADRAGRVAVVRAVAVVFSESGPAGQRDAVRAWLRGLLRDPEEKVRRYAVAALPKIGTGAEEEAELLHMLRTSASPRERAAIAEGLAKIGGAGALDPSAGAGVLPLGTEQKIRASVARTERPAAIRFDRVLSGFDRLRIHLRGRRGLEQIVREEVEASARLAGKFRVVEVDRGLVAITPLAEWTLGDLFSLRCFGTAGFVLGLVKPEADPVEAIAGAIASPRSQRLFAALTDGAWRYRLGFEGKGHQRGAVRQVVERAYALCPEILNDAREAPWAIEVHPTAHGDSVELRPRLARDPRLFYRTDDVPAASHPPLAASMARLAGVEQDEIVWDPFCGSGLELIERALLGGVARVHGTDRDEQAIAISQANFAAANPPGVSAEFTRCDFRDFTAGRAGTISLIITNPPLGRRIRIPNLRGLFEDLFAAAVTVLRPGGRLVLTNPLRMETMPPSLKLESRRVVDLGGFDCRLEVYRKSAGPLRGAR